MAVSTTQKVKLPINVGPLNGIGSFCVFTADKLRKFSNLYREGLAPEVEWDLRNVEPRQMSMAGLTAFLATAHRLRQFTKDTPSVLVKWNPQIFSFWNSISLFDIAQKYDLLKWPSALVDNSWSGETSHNTELLIFPYTLEPPDRTEYLDSWKDWKDSVRQKFKDDLLLRCGRLFQKSREGGVFPQKLKDRVAIACAELVVNSLLWGRSTAFVGLQRSSKRITVAVCDSGRGFLDSLYEQHSSKQMVHPISHIEAITLGSFINTREYGLRRVIDTVVSNGGEVVVSSYDAQLHWKEPLWVRAKQAATGDDLSPLNIKRLISSIGEPISGKTTAEDHGRGFYRIWPNGLRGVRIAFEIPLPENEGY